MKVIYLASGHDRLEYENVTYQDINNNRDLGGDMLEVDLSDYDILIATPPCNYWSRANYRRETSEYSQKTKHLLPEIIKKFLETKKPFIVENVRNFPLFEKNNLMNIEDVKVYYLGRHTYWTNINISDILIKVELPDKNIQNIAVNKRQGGKDITQLFNLFIKKIKEKKEKEKTK